jgi:hypothetical protein
LAKSPTKSKSEFLGALIEGRRARLVQDWRVYPRLLGSAR